MLANSNIPQISIEKEPTYFIFFIKRYCETYPMMGPTAIPILVYIQYQY